MGQARFIEIPTVSGKVTIAIDNIASVQSYIGGTKITLKEIKDGSNVELVSTADYQAIVQMISNENDQER